MRTAPSFKPIKSSLQLKTFFQYLLLYSKALPDNVDAGLNIPSCFPCFQRSITKRSCLNWI